MQLVRGPRAAATGCGALPGQKYAENRTFLLFHGGSPPQRDDPSVNRVYKAAEEYDNEVLCYSLGHWLGDGDGNAPSPGIEGFVAGRRELQFLRLLPRVGGQVVPAAALNGEDAVYAFSLLLEPALLGSGASLTNNVPPKWGLYNREMDEVLPSARDALSLRRQRQIARHYDQHTVADEIDDDLVSNIPAATAAVSVALVKLLSLLKQTTELPAQQFLWEARPAVRRLAVTGMRAGVKQVLASEDAALHAECAAAYAAWEDYCVSVALPLLKRASPVLPVERVDRQSSIVLAYEDNRGLVGRVPVSGEYDYSMGHVVGFQSTEERGVAWASAAQAHFLELVEALESNTMSDEFFQQLDAYTMLAYAETRPGMAGSLDTLVVAGSAAYNGGCTRYLEWQPHGSPTAVGCVACCVEVDTGDVGVASECMRVSQRLTAGMQKPTGDFEAHALDLSKMYEREYREPQPTRHLRLGGYYTCEDGDVARLLSNESICYVTQESLLREMLPEYADMEAFRPVSELAFGGVFVTPLTTNRKLYVPESLRNCLPPGLLFEHSLDPLCGVWVKWNKQEGDHTSLWLLDGSNEHLERFRIQGPS